MVVELTVIDLAPASATRMSLVSRVPKTVYRRKLFILENLGIEECTTAKGKVIPDCSVVKYEGEYYKLKIPYEELKALYSNYKPIKGLSNA